MANLWISPKKVQVSQDPSPQSRSEKTPIPGPKELQAQAQELHDQLQGEDHPEDRAQRPCRASRSEPKLLAASGEAPKMRQNSPVAGYLKKHKKKGLEKHPPGRMQGGLKFEL